jgi:hypothetical protein
LVNRILTAGGLIAGEALNLPGNFPVSHCQHASAWADMRDSQAWFF